MAVQRTLPSPLERRLLEKGVGDRVREGARCADCGRTPLIGEHVHRYEGGAIRCELCRPLRREQPVISELVHGPEHGHCLVRVIRAAA